MLGKGCKGIYTGSHLSIDGSPPTSIRAITSSVQGYIEELCVECRNKGQKINIDNLTIKQSSNSCTSAIRVKEFRPQNILQSYDSVGERKIADYQYFFDNFDPVNCPVTDCHIFQSGCIDLNNNQKITT